MLLPLTSISLVVDSNILRFRRLLTTPTLLLPRTYHESDYEKEPKCRSINQFAQYELCFGNAFYYKPSGGNIKSTGFKIFGLGDTVYLTDFPNNAEG